MMALLYMIGRKGSKGSGGRFLRWTGLTAGRFLGLTRLLAPRVMVAASPQIIKKGARLTPQVV